MRKHHTWILKQVQDDKRGFSLVEIVLALGIFAITIFVMTSFRGNISVLDNLINQKLQSRQDLDQTFQVMVTELRSAGPSSLGAYAIESVGTSSLTFYSDYDADGIFERIRYFLQPGVNTSTLRRGVVEPIGNPLVYNTSTETVSDVGFHIVNTTSTNLLQYYGPSATSTLSATLTAPIDVSLVRYVKITLWADVKPRVSPKPVFFTQTVTVRNLRSN